MTISELLIEEFDAEMAGTRRVLERIPSHPDFKPHEKSMPMGRLAMHVAYLPLFGKYILTKPGMDMANRTPDMPFPSLVYTDGAHLLEAFDTSAKETREVLVNAKDDELASIWKFSFGDKVISEKNRALTYRTLFLNHLIHHRAQLGIYLRLNECPVPALYGPSADEPM